MWTNHDDTSPKTEFLDLMRETSALETKMSKLLRSAKRIFKESIKDKHWTSDEISIVNDSLECSHNVSRLRVQELTRTINIVSSKRSSKNDPFIIYNAIKRLSHNARQTEDKKWKHLLKQYKQKLDSQQRLKNLRATEKKNKAREAAATATSQEEPNTRPHKRRRSTNNDDDDDHVIDDLRSLLGGLDDIDEDGVCDSDSDLDNNDVEFNLN
jgi:hypothetical protein